MNRNQTYAISAVFSSNMKLLAYLTATEKIIVYSVALERNGKVLQKRLELDEGLE